MDEVLAGGKEEIRYSCMKYALTKKDEGMMKGERR